MEHPRQRGRGVSGVNDEDEITDLERIAALLAIVVLCLLVFA